MIRPDADDYRRQMIYLGLLACLLLVFCLAFGSVLGWWSSAHTSRKRREQQRRRTIGEKGQEDAAADADLESHARQEADQTGREEDGTLRLTAA